MLRFLQVNLDADESNFRGDGSVCLLPNREAVTPSSPGLEVATALRLNKAESYLPLGLRSRLAGINHRYRCELTGKPRRASPSNQ